MKLITALKQILKKQKKQMPDMGDEMTIPMTIEDKTIPQAAAVIIRGWRLADVAERSVTVLNPDDDESVRVKELATNEAGDSLYSLKPAFKTAFPRLSERKFTLEELELELSTHFLLLVVGGRGDDDIMEQSFVGVTATPWVEKSAVVDLSDATAVAVVVHNVFHNAPTANTFLVVRLGD